MTKQKEIEIPNYVHNQYIYINCVRCRSQIPIVANYNSEFLVDTEHKCIPVLIDRGYQKYGFLNDEIKKKYLLLPNKNEEAKKIQEDRIKENGGIYCHYHIKFGRVEWRCNEECKKNRGGYLCKECSSGFVIDGKCEYCGWIDKKFIKMERMKNA